MTPVPSPAVAAAADAFRVVRRSMSHDTSSATHWMILFAVAAVGGLWVGLIAWDRRRRPGVRSVNTGLFDELCRAHALSPEDRGLLRRAVAGGQPAAVFTDPEHLRRHAAAHEADADACAALAERLFGLVGHAGPAS